MIIKREWYLSQIRPFLGTPFIKVLSGIRRCGKSTMLELLREEILAAGVEPGNIIYINLETREDLNTAKDLSEALKARIGDAGKVYIFLDEIQMIPGWERTVNSFFAGKKAEIFITGSNSMLLSSKLATLLSGRYVQFTIRPLSFAEYLDFTRDLRKAPVDDIPSLMWEYIKLGGFPGNFYAREMNSAFVYKTVYDIFSTVVLKDVMWRNNLRNTDLLERVIKFLFDTSGSLVSARSISGYFKNQGRKVSVDTILGYTSALEAAHVVEKVRRYDVKGKKLLNIREKYYAADVSLIHALLGYDDKRLPGLMETVIYGELRRRGYEVFTGQYDDREIDFVCIKGSEKLYVQAAYLIGNDQKIIQREFGNLLQIPDQYPKYVVSLDDKRTSSVEGVRHCYLPDFLLNAALS
jgi:predicted AAA+ superfamily ATPase